MKSTPSTQTQLRAKAWVQAYIHLSPRLLPPPWFLSATSLTFPSCHFFCCQSQDRELDSAPCSCLCALSSSPGLSIFSNSSSFPILRKVWALPALSWGWTPGAHQLPLGFCFPTPREGREWLLSPSPPLPLRNQRSCPGIKTQS